MSNETKPSQDSTPLIDNSNGEIAPDVRFTYANERTFLAWNRTALALIATGVIVVGVLPKFQIDFGRRVLAIPMILLGAFMSFASIREWSANEYAMRHELPLRSDQMVRFTPIPLLADAPSDVPRDESLNRVLQLFFLDEDPVETWDANFAGLGDEFAAAGLGQVVFASPFRATVPGTDTYTDQLW